ncbi:phosphotransferase [Bacillus gobiensis]|uniref:phosphotransferase enzyme family protein n=1 Tax=Bacillus gobiensis TaxID=1441095 RepID=UPI003D1CE495
MDKVLLSKGAKKFEVDVSELQLVGGFSNNVFEYNGHGENFIIKFYPSSKYKKDTIRAELDWIRFLLSSGVNVTAPLRSVYGHYMEIIQGDNGEECYVIAFEKAKGTFINVSDTDNWNKEFFYKWGKTLGKIHSLSKKYKPLDEKIKKQHWNNGLLFTESNDEIDKVIVNKWEEFINELKQLPKDINGYGMIHNDLHQRNFYLYNKEIVLFDFGDCEYNWFVYDIAIVLYHAVQTIDENDLQGREDFALLFIKAFLRGYLTENNLDDYWLFKLPFFLNYRQIFSYFYFVRFLNEEQKKDKKIKSILNSMRKRIENDTPYLDIQYKDFCLKIES